MNSFLDPLAAASAAHQVRPHLHWQRRHAAAAFVAGAVAISTVMATGTAMGLATKLVSMKMMNLTVSPGKISVTSTEMPNVMGNQVISVMRMANCKSAARKSQDTQQFTIAVVMKIAAARLEHLSKTVKCGSIRIATSLVIVSN